MAKTFKRAIAVLLSVLMIATTLPFTAITASAADSVTYNFTENKSYSNWNNGNYENGHQYTLMGDGGTASTGNGVLTLLGGCMFAEDETVRNIFTGGNFYVEFQARQHEEGDRVLGAVFSNGVNYIRLDTTGEFYVNDELKETVEMSPLAKNVYAFVYDGSAVKLYINGIERACVNETLSIPNNNTRFVSLGFSDYAISQKMNNATYDYLTVSSAEYDPSTFTSGKKASATSAGDVKVGTAKGYFEGKEMTGGYYANLLYSSDTTSWNSWSSRGTKDNFAYLNDSNNHLSMKIVVPTNTVMMYDGKNDSYIGVKAESRIIDSGSKTRYYNYIASGNAGLEYRDYWRYNWTVWNTWDPTGFVEGDKEYTGYSTSTDHAMNNSTNSSSLFFFNKLYLAKNIEFDAKNYMEIQPKVDVKICSDTYTTVSNNDGKIYVVNYKPIADIYADVKAKVAEVSAKCEGYYVNADEFYSAAANLLNLDPNTYGYTNTVFDVRACAGDIKEAVIDYNAVELVKHTCVESETKQENEVAPSGDKAGSHDEVVYCTICGEEISRNKVVDLSYEAYEDEVAVVEALDSTLYTDESWTDLQTAKTEAAADVLTATTQDEINAATAKLMTAVSNLKTKGYTVTVNVQKNGEKYCEPIVASVNAGGLYTYSAPAGEQIYKAVYGGQKLVNGSNSFDIIVTKDMEIFVYLTDEVAADTKVKATFKAANGKVVAVQYYENNTAINVNDIAAPVIPFYNFDQWARVSDSEKNIVFEATYTPAMDVDDEIAEKCTIHAIDMTIKNGLTDYDAFYDEIIGFNAGGNKIAMYADADRTELLAYVDSDYYMHAPRRAEVWIAPASASEYVGITGSYAYIDEAGLTTAVFNANKIGTGVEYGVVATLSSTVAYEMSTYKFEAGEKFVVTAPTTKVSSIGEFTVAIHSDFGDRTVVYAKPYVKHANGTYTYGNVVELDITQLA